MNRKMKEVARRVADLIEAMNYAGQRGLQLGTERELVAVKASNPREVGGFALSVAQNLATQPGWTAVYDGTTDLVVGAKSPGGEYEVMTDAGKWVLEYCPLAPCDSLNSLDRLCGEAERTIISASQGLGFEVLGLGRHPLFLANRSSWTPKLRYNGLQSVLKNGGHETCETASHQDTVDVRNSGHMMQVVNIGNALAGPVAAICANSLVFHGEVHQDQLASRLLTWQRICHPVQFARVGIPMVFRDVGHYAEYLVRLPYLFHIHETGVADVFDKPFYEAVEYFESVDFGRLLQIHMACVWFDARVRMNKCASVELRAPCAQPQGMGQAVSALHLGLVHNSAAASNLVLTHSWDEWQAARFDAANLALNASVGSEPMAEVVRSMLHVAEDGLRLAGEDPTRLAPLWQRLEDPSQLPAMMAGKLFAEGGIDALVEARRFQLQQEPVARAS